MTNARAEQNAPPIRVLIVDDSPISRRVMVDLITQTPDMEVVGEAVNGIEAVRMNHSLHPSIIAMKLILPLVDGLRATEFIMKGSPNRIVLFADKDALANPDLMRRATAAGALDLCEKPRHNSSDEVGVQFVKTLRALAEVKVVQRRKTGELSLLSLEDADLERYPGIAQRPELVVIVASTGGPPALETILRELPPDFPLPIVYLQHIEDEFTGNLAQWLGSVIPLKVKLAEDRERPLPGWVYIAPDSRHLSMSFNGNFHLDDDGQGYRHVPSGDILLESVARVYGPNAIGILLTGMGHDGAKGLHALRKQGAHTIVQDEATSVVFGMPKEAIELGAAEHVSALGNVARLLIRLCKEGLESEKEAK